MVNDTLVVIFDGRCRFCAWVIRTVQNLDRDHRLEMVPCQSVEGVEHYGITLQRCDEQVFVIDRGGNLLKGGQAAMLVVATALGQPWLARVAGWPVVRQVVHAGYRLLAKIRRRLPGPATWCDEHPAQCIDGE